MSDSDWISDETNTLASCIREIGKLIDFNIGNPLKSPKKGDALWYCFKTSGGSFLIIMCTPYAIFSESDSEDSFSELDYSIITQPTKFLQNAKNSGYIFISKDELDNL